MINRKLLSLVATIAIPAPLFAQAPSTTVTASANVAVVGTQSGKVQGFVRAGIFTFRGIPYAEAERFQPATKPKPWSGVRLALSYGNICPQPINPELREPQTFVSDTRYWPMSENCQSLNIWSPGLDAKKRPVMVWIHGGGYFSGSSMELPIYDGTNLARKGDVIVVSLNHRLNILGFLDLSAYGPAYQASGNLGMADIVVALQWVRDNIRSFGGDPANVTIFGQSGGGGKVSTLLTAPSAHGLFEKAVIESGIMGPPASRALDPKVSRHVADLVFQNAGVAVGDIKALQALPYDRLQAAGDKALMQASGEAAGAGSGLLGFPRINWGPVVDGAFLPEAPFADGAPTLSADVPLLIGSTLREFQLINPQLADRRSWSEAQTIDFLRRQYGDRTGTVVAAYRRAYPQMKPYDWPTIDIGGRAGVLSVAAQKARQPAPVYTYLFALDSPVLDGAWSAGHSSEIAFVFDNAELGVQSSGGGPDVDRLTAVMSQAWVNFARSGNPNGVSGMPNWPRFRATNPATMMFYKRPETRIGHDAALIAAAQPAQ